jgi:hypothetical protein
MVTRQQTPTPAEPTPFVFTGRIVELKAATLPDIASDRTAIVEVDHVVSSPAMFAALTGAQITVRFAKPPTAARGATLTFFTKGWIYGQGIAVDAVEVRAESTKPVAAESLRSTRSDSKDAVLKARLKSAEIGVVGEVTAVKAAGIQTTRISEHDPAWHEATIRVDEVVKGKKGTKAVKVLFPQSDDVRWHKVAKYTTGQQGIWLLHKAATQDATGIAAKAFPAIAAAGDALTAAHDADFLSLDELGRVKALLKK